MIAVLISGHGTLSDWSFLVALVAFVVAAALVVRPVVQRPAGGRTDPLAAVLPLVGLALVALGLLVV